jgi:argininosuccinate lyase
MIDTTTFNSKNISGGNVKGHALATEIADYLARKGVPFSEAHEISGKCVKVAEKQGIEVHELSDSDLQGVDSRLDSGIRKFLSAEGALESRTSALSASPKSVTKQLTNLTSTLNAQSAWIAGERKRFSGMMSS